MNKCYRRNNTTGLRLGHNEECTRGVLTIAMYMTPTCAFLIRRTRGCRIHCNSKHPRVHSSYDRKSTSDQDGSIYTVQGYLDTLIQGYKRTPNILYASSTSKNQLFIFLYISINQGFAEALKVSTRLKRLARTKSE